MKEVKHDTADSPDFLESIAIIGMSLRFPGEATNPEGLWKILCDKKTTSSEIPRDRFNVDAFYHPSTERGGTVRAKFIDHKHKLKLPNHVLTFFSVY